MGSDNERIPAGIIRSVMEFILFPLKCVSSLGTLVLAIELFRICTMLDDPRIRKFAWKVFIFFGTVGLIKILSSVIDTFWLDNPYAGIVSNTIIVYILLYWVYRKRIELGSSDLSTESRTRLSKSMLEIVDSMKMAQVRIHNELNSDA